jgi:two-component system, NtrC family, response regulator AtoC
MSNERHDDGPNDTSTEKLPVGEEGPPLPPRPSGVSVLFFHRSGVDQMPLNPDKPPKVVGRRPPSDLCIPDPSLSQRHAQLTLVNGRVLLEDLGSTNGTWVERRRIIEPAVLPPGGEAVLGNVLAHVVALGPVSTPSLQSEADFFKELDTELKRGRSFALLAVHPGKAEATRATGGSWVLQFRIDRRPVARMSLWRSNTALLLLPEASIDEALLVAHEITSDAGTQGGTRRVGVVVYPKDGSSTHKLIDRACYAADRASPEQPVVAASTDQAWEGDVGERTDPIFGAGQQKLLGHAGRAASSTAVVSIYGETGTGKEEVARFLHQSGPRYNKPFIAVNCGAIQKSLVESELFGHEKGAFTGAGARRQGCFEAANGGTLFLDEIGELEIEIQNKLLRVLATHTIQRVGSHKEVPVDVRIITATNRDLKTMVKEGRFREDLYYRLVVIELKIPPLRERLDEIEPLARRFLKQRKEEDGSSGEHRFTKEAMDLLRAYRWPGNVRELRNVVDRVVVLAEGELIEPEHIRPYLHAAEPSTAAPGGLTATSTPVDAEDPATGGDIKGELRQVEKQKIEAALHGTGWKVEKAAALLGMSRRTLSRRMGEFDLKRPKR